jgi:hypothetical protein
MSTHGSKLPAAMKRYIELISADMAARQAEVLRCGDCTRAQRFDGRVAPHAGARAIIVSCSLCSMPALSGFRSLHTIQASADPRMTSSQTRRLRDLPAHGTGHALSTRHIYNILHADCSPVLVHAGARSSNTFRTAFEGEHPEYECPS